MSDINENFVKADLFGFGNHESDHIYRFKLKNNKIIKIENNKIIDKMIISDDINSITLYLKNNKYYEDYEDEINTFLYNICFNMLIYEKMYFNIPYYRITSYTKKDNSIILQDNMTFCGESELILFDGDPENNFYKSILETNNAIHIKKLKYEILFKILHNNNMICKFLALYQYLYDLVKDFYKQNKQKFKGQESVIEYLHYKCGERLDHQNPNRKNRDEDVYTYYRNKIAHAENTNNMVEYMDINRTIHIEIIRNLLKRINELIIKIN